MIPLQLAASLLLLQAPTGVIDQGVLVVRRDSQEVARETFHLLERRSRRPRQRVAPGCERAVDRTAGSRPCSPRSLELTPDSTPAALAFDVTANGTSQHITRTARARALHAALCRSRTRAGARGGGGAGRSSWSTIRCSRCTCSPPGTRGPHRRCVTAIFPRTAERVTLTVTDLRGRGHDAEPGSRDAAPRARSPAGRSVRFMCGSTPQGRLMKVEAPDQTLRAERLPA